MFQNNFNLTLDDSTYKSLFKKKNSPAATDLLGLNMQESHIKHDIFNDNDLLSGTGG